MIAFNGQYLPAASHGNMRITAACLGGQWVIGGWLKTATQQAIIAAFGAEEGIAVISRTNDYLNRIATTDPTSGATKTKARTFAISPNEYSSARTSSLGQNAPTRKNSHGKKRINQKNHNH